MVIGGDFNTRIAEKGETVWKRSGKGTEKETENRKEIEDWSENGIKTFKENLKEGNQRRTKYKKNRVN